MNKQVAEIKAASGIATALAAAQMEMGKALKQSNNPHFRSKYADLGNVMDACMGPLNQHGIAVIQPTGEDENGRFVKTVLIHGESGETLECRVPLIVGKNDMQGYGSAVTYARRYGLMSMAGIAPEEDDGNAAAKNPPKEDARPTPQPTVSPDQYIKLRDKAQEAGVSEEAICERAGCPDLQQFPAAQFDSVMKKLAVTIEQRAPKNADLGGDGIPY